MMRDPELVYRCHDYLKSFFTSPFRQRHSILSSERYQPFFIIGSGRSGNTLFRRLLNSHSDIYIPPETYVLATVIRRYRQNDRRLWPVLVENIFQIFESHPEFETFNLNLSPLVEELKDSPETKQNLAYLLNRFYLYAAEQAGSKCVRWGDKTPLNTFYLDRIYSVFPDARFLHVLRDGCDVVSSYIESGIYSSLKDAALRWKKSVICVDRFAKKYPGSVFTLRYEDLVQDTATTLKQVCQWLGVEYEEAMSSLSQDVSKQSLGDVELKSHHSNVLNPVNTQSIGKGREKLSEESRKLIDAIIGDDLKRLGYKSCTY